MFFLQVRARRHAHAMTPAFRTCFIITTKVFKNYYRTLDNLYFDI